MAGDSYVSVPCADKIRDVSSTICQARQLRFHVVLRTKDLNLVQLGGNVFLNVHIFEGEDHFINPGFNSQQSHYFQYF